MLTVEWSSKALRWRLEARLPSEKKRTWGLWPQARAAHSRALGLRRLASKGSTCEGQKLTSRRFCERSGLSTERCCVLSRGAVPGAAVAVLLPKTIEEASGVVLPRPSLDSNLQVRRVLSSPLHSSPLLSTPLPLRSIALLSTPLRSFPFFACLLFSTPPVSGIAPKQAGEQPIRPGRPGASDARLLSNPGWGLAAARGRHVAEAHEGGLQRAPRLLGACWSVCGLVGAWKRWQAPSRFTGAV